MSLADSTGTSSVADESWINWYCNLNGHGVLCEVDRSFIEDSFNLFGLKQFVNKDFNKALATILDRNGEVIFATWHSFTSTVLNFIFFFMFTDSEPDDEMELDRSAALLYGLIHARYIITTNGLNAMVNCIYTFICLYFANHWKLTLFIVKSFFNQQKKYLHNEFGECPRAYCQNQPVLPVSFFFSYYAYLHVYRKYIMRFNYVHNTRINLALFLYLL